MEAVDDFYVEMNTKMFPGATERHIRTMMRAWRGSPTRRELEKTAMKMLEPEPGTFRKIMSEMRVTPAMVQRVFGDLAERLDSAASYTGGRPAAFGPQSKARICREIERRRKKEKLTALFREVAEREHRGMRTIQQVWLERNKWTGGRK
jgi:hypothetical protein